MLVEQTMEKLVSMQLTGMAEELRRWMEQPKEKQITPLDIIGLLADAEWRHRQGRKLTARLRTARFRQDACVDNIDYQHSRGLQKAVMLDLAACRWVEAHQNVIFSGQTAWGRATSPAPSVRRRVGRATRSSTAGPRACTTNWPRREPTAPTSCCSAAPPSRQDGSPRDR
jgi:hypothetical protein